jgi:lactose/L-arabinose transport system substrate-binding protein
MEDFMKKIVSVSLILLAVLMLFAACSKKEEAAAPAAAGAAAAPAGNKVLVWCWDPLFNVYSMNEATKIYQRDNPNFELEALDITEIEQKLNTALSAGDTANLPDIVLNQDNSMKRFIETYTDAYLPVDGKVDLSQFASFKVAVGEYEGKHYGVPFDNGTTGLYLRTDLLEQAGLKASDFNNITWDRFLELGQQVKAKINLQLISISAPGVDMLNIMLSSTGLWYFQDDGSKVYVKDNPAIKAACIMFDKLVKAGVLNMVQDWNAYIASFNNSNCVGTLQGCWIMASIQGVPDQAGKWAMVTTPRFSDTSFQSVNYSVQGGSGWMVMSHTKVADLAMDFLNKTFAGSKELYDIILPGAGAVSTWLPAAESAVYQQPAPFYQGEKVYAMLMDYASKAKIVPYAVFNYEARDAVGRALTAYMAGQGQIDALLANEEQQLINLIGG